MKAARLLFLVMGGVAISAGSVVQAQQVPAPSQVAPPTVAPQLPARTRIVLPRVVAGGAVPAEAKKLFFTLKGFDVLGEFHELVDERKALQKPLVGKRVSVAQVFAFASELQGLYVRAGYPLVRVVITPQELGSVARVKLRIIDGFVERIDASNIDGPVRTRVLAVVGSLVNQRHLKQHELERKLLIAGEAPGLILNAVFTAGKKLGGSVLVLAGSYKPVSVSLYSDNSMPAVFGGYQLVGTASLNSVLGFGERLTVSAAGLPDRDFTTEYPTRRYLGATLSVPLGVDGWSLEGGITTGLTTPRVTSASAVSQGKLTQGFVGLQYEAVKLRDQELTFGAKFEATNEELDSLLFTPALPLNLDRTRVLRASVRGLTNWRTAGAALSYGATLSEGLDAFGARSASDASTLLPLSRAGADATFTKLQGNLAVQKALPYGLFISLAGSGQTSFNKPLLTSEQFDIVGASMVSGYDAGSFSGDSAWVTRAEFGKSLVLPTLPVVLTPYLFAATGERILAQPTALEQGSVHASNFGLGLRYNVASSKAMPVSFSGFIEGSRQNSDDSTQDGWRLFVGALARY